MNWLSSSPLLAVRRPITGYTDYSSRSSQSFLQGVIRNLLDSVDEEERLSLRNKLENDLEVATERMDTLVREHREKLHGTLSTFEKIDSTLRASQERVRVLKTGLTSCKTLLRCKRDELKRLWLEDVKFKHMLKMIDSIEEVRAVPEQLRIYKQNKHYLHATELLVNNVARLEGELQTVEALKDLRQELRQQKEHLPEELIDELHRHLYVKATAKRAPAKHRHTRTPSDGPHSGSKPEASPGLNKRNATVLGVRPSRSATRTAAMEREFPSSSAVPSQPTIRERDEVKEDLGADPEEDSSHFMAIVIESLSVLGRVQDALDAIQSRMQREFLLIIERASIQVIRSAEQQLGLPTQGRRKVARENQPRLLLRLLQICFERFRNVVSAHSVLLGHLLRARKVYKASYELYQESDVWAAVQNVLQNVLEVYLAYDEESSPQSGLAGFSPFSGGSDINTFFAVKKKTATKGTKKLTFRFDSSRHAISVSSYMREQRDLELAEGMEGGEGVPHSSHLAEDQPSISHHLVCKAMARNITVVFGALREFVLEIEEALQLRADKHCSLYYSLHEFVEQRFLYSIKYECAEKLTGCAKPEAAKMVASDQKTSKLVGTKQFVLNSVLVIWQLVEELRGLMRDLPMYSAHFLDILCELLQGYRDSCNSIYKELSLGSVEGLKGVMGGQESVISSKWARDEDINRMIRSLPNWMKLRQGGKGKGWGDEDGNISIYTRESETLCNNLGSEPLRRGSVVLNAENLRLLAILHESMDWFNGRLKQVVMELTNQGMGVASPTPAVRVMSDRAMMAEEEESTDSAAQDKQTLDLSLMEQLSKIQFDFQSLAETTVIMLHLELRCHCFYFLLPAVQRSYTADHDSLESEQAVRALATDLKDIDTVMVSVLTPEKYRYLFEGLGHLVSAIFISSTQHMKTVTRSRVKKICTSITLLQSCLSKITLIREKDLDKARLYFEMLLLTGEEIFHQISEQGTQFSQKEYVNALTLMSRSHLLRRDPTAGGTPAEQLEHDLHQLDSVFSRDSV